MRFLNVVFLLTVVVACTAQADTSKVVDAIKFKEAISRQDIQILDVRTSAEFQSGHIRNALLANWNKRDEFYSSIQYMDKSKPVYVYCAAGVRSKAAADWMRKNGFAKVVELKDGINSWRKAGFPLE